MKKRVHKLVEELGQPYSEKLGIKISRGPKEICKWFLASILFGAPIRESSAIKTYECFKKYNVLTPRKIIETGWDGLVEILDEGTYTRYDFKTATKLLEVFGNLQEQYNGNLNRLHEAAKDSKDLEEKIKSLGKGIGNITVSIFLREMRNVWKKAEPRPTPLVKIAMDNLKIKDLKEFSKKEKIPIVRLETALLRFGRDFLKKKPKPKNK